MSTTSINAFVEYLTLEKKYSVHTTLAYQKDLELFQSFCTLQQNSDDINRVSYSEIRSWIVSLVNGHLSNRTINRKVSSLKSFYKFFRKQIKFKIAL